MKIYRTSGTGTAGNINLKIINKTELGEIVYDQNLPMSYNGGTTYIDVVEGNLYYMKVTPLASGQTYAAFVVSQE